MRVLLCLLILVGCSLAYPQYGPVAHEEINQEPLSEDFSQTKEVDATQVTDQKPQNFWWQGSGIFSENNNDKPFEPAPGEGVGGPFTPHQSKFCETGFDCVPYEICFQGFISMHGGSVLQERSKPSDYDTLKCGQSGNICCGIPEDILTALNENIEGNIETVESVPGNSEIVEYGEEDQVGNQDKGQYIDPQDETIKKMVEEFSSPKDSITQHDTDQNVDPKENPVNKVEIEEYVNPYEKTEFVEEKDVSENNYPGSNTEVKEVLDSDAVPGYDPLSVPDEEKVDVSTGYEKPSAAHVDAPNVKPNYDQPSVIEVEKTDVGPSYDQPSIPREEKSDVIPGYNQPSNSPDNIPNYDQPTIHHELEPIPPVDFEIDACGHISYKCVPFFLCRNGVIVTDGSGLIDVRVKPQGVCTHPDHPNVPGVCCLVPGLDPTPSPIQEKCLDEQECVDQRFCSAQGVILTEGIGTIDIRTGGHKTCYRPSGEIGVCCNRPPPFVEACYGNSICTPQSSCFGQALNAGGEFVDNVKIGKWSYCSYGKENGVCCIQSPPTAPEVIKYCPGNSECILGNQCTGKALDASNNYVDYALGGESWASCSLGNIYGICCIIPAPIVRESCPENSKCVLGNQCSGLALDISNSFVDYSSSGAWSYCSIGNVRGVCCKTIPSAVIDCPGESVCLDKNHCFGTALDNTKKFLEYSPTGLWSYCSESDLKVCCINTKPYKPTDLQPAPECGIRNYNIDERIISSKYGVNEAAFGEFPWQAVIFYQNFTYVCGATIVSNKYVITAAHCVDGLQPGDIRIRFGEWQIVSTDEILPYEDRNVFKIYIHDQFNPKNVHKDFAVLELYDPIKYQYHINSVCLPPQGFTVKPYTKCIATGWGKDSFEGSFQHILKKIELPYLDHQTCQDLLRKTRLGKYFRLDDSFLCAGGEENKDACYGDGGGPLVCKDEPTSQYFLVGITSWGIGCGTKEVPGVYANIPSYVQWIDNVIKGGFQAFPEQTHTLITNEEQPYIAEPQNTQINADQTYEPSQPQEIHPSETQPYEVLPQESIPDDLKPYVPKHDEPQPPAVEFHGQPNEEHLSQTHHEVQNSEISEFEHNVPQSKEPEANQPQPYEAPNDNPVHTQVEPVEQQPQDIPPFVGYGK